MPQMRTFQEKPGKFWATLPPRGEEHFDSIFDAIDARNAAVNQMPMPPGVPPMPRVERRVSTMTLQDILTHAVIGLAHSIEVARARAEESYGNPRPTADRLYDRSFVEPAYSRGPLAVLAYTALNDGQPEEWLVEGFVGDEVTPSETHTLAMRFPTVFGVDIRDAVTLNEHIDRWYPL